MNGRPGSVVRMDTTTDAETEAQTLAVEAAGLTREIERYQQLASEKAVERAEKWRRANRLGLSYAQLGEVAGVHFSQIGRALERHRSRRRRRHNA